ncbi:MAG: Flagellar assembly factor FliW [Syntrophus sp. SKADARSKE-3]|nr:Flagellar assembly factor FliW [Syntrophus sp. SKADARSKE-3]
MITIDTTRFGKIEVEDPRIITMQEGGILGFGHLRQFILLIPDEKKAFWWLQSVEDGAVAFLVTDPFKIFPNYEPGLSSMDVESLHIEDESDVVLLSIITVKYEPSLSITANLRAPIAINMKGMMARQIVLERDDYDIRYEIKNIQENAAGQDSAERIKAVCA